MLKKTLNLILLLGVVACGAAAFWLWREGYVREAGFEFLKANREMLHGFVRGHRLLSLAAYVGVYSLYVGLFLPGTAALSLAGGVLFGFWEGLAAACLSRALGSVLACRLSRLFLRNWVRRRFPQAMDEVDRGMAEDGGAYVFLVRVAPAFPFNISNIFLGLTAYPLWPMFLITLAGVVPRTLMWAQAGGELARIEVLADFARPITILTLCVLAAAPLAVKKLTVRWRARKRSLPAGADGGAGT